MNRFESLKDGEEIFLEDADKFEPYPNENLRLKLHTGEKKQQLLESIRNSGVLDPIIAMPSKIRGKLTVIAGWNRVSICSELGIQVPYRLKTELTQDQADLICIDTNLLSRQYEDMLSSELAYVLKSRNDILKRQGERADLTKDPVGLRELTINIIGKECKLSATNVKRYIRLTFLIKPLLDLVDKNKIAFRTGVELSFLKSNEQLELIEYITNNKYKIPLTIAESLKKLSLVSVGNIDIESELNKLSTKKETNKSLKLNHNDLIKHIPESDIKNAKSIIIKALELYYSV